MSERTYATEAILDRGFAHHQPTFRFAGYGRADAGRWREGLVAALREILGPIPSPGDPPPYIVTERTELPDHVRERIVIEMRLGEHVPAYLLTPKGRTAPGPAALCIHGHRPGGKASVAIPGDGSEIAFGAALAGMGIVALCPDHAGMGERDGDGGCELLWRRLNYFGRDVTGTRVADLVRSTDLLAGLPTVDPARIGSVGFSLGCWLGMVHAALDDRVRAAVLSGYFTTFAQTSWLGHCICHHPKGIGFVAEMPDIAGLIAPRPVAVEWGIEDTSRPVQPAFGMAQRIWSAAGAPEALDLFVFNGPHRFDGAESLPWLVRQLGA